MAKELKSSLSRHQSLRVPTASVKMIDVDNVSEYKNATLPHRPRRKEALPKQCGTLTRNKHKPDLLEVDKAALVEMGFRAASLEKLVEVCIDCFDAEGNLARHVNYPRILFLMHDWFTSSEELIKQFKKIYYRGKLISCKSRCSHLSAFEDCKVYQHKARVCHALRYWIHQFPIHFVKDNNLSSIIAKFQDAILTEGYVDLSCLTDMSKLPSYDWARNPSVKGTSPNHRPCKISLVFDHLEPADLAKHLTYLEFRVMRRITFADYKNYAVTCNMKDNPLLERSIALFNGLSQWIQCMVLNRTTPQQRAEVVIKFVNVAKNLKLLQNFNTLMAVVGGLSHSALARLSKTNSCLPAETQKTLQDFTELLSSASNFSNYRKALHECVGVRIPILGVHLKDLISLHTAMPDRIDGQINYRKMVQLASIFSELIEVQNASVPVDANMDLINTLKLSLDLHYTEDEIYELSLGREPRNSLSGPNSPNKPTVFAEWAADASPPDADTINKHINAVVEAVFRNYDRDRDGYISQTEFDSITNNFPFIDSFCVLDADQDGMISKVEMRKYFVQFNSHALRNSFKHAFHETTYFKPTFCVHCTGLLWGLIKQGFKCKDCGINAHKHCKDLVVMECRPKSHTSRSSSFSSTDVSVTSKRKISQFRRRPRKQTQTDDCKASVSISDSEYKYGDILVKKRESESSSSGEETSQYDESSVFEKSYADDYASSDADKDPSETEPSVDSISLSDSSIFFAKLAESEEVQSEIDSNCSIGSSLTEDQSPRESIRNSSSPDPNFGS